MFSRFSSRMLLLRCPGNAPATTQPSRAGPSPTYSHGDEGTRTPDFLLAKQALSRLSYVPACGSDPTRTGDLSLIRRVL